MNEQEIKQEVKQEVRYYEVCPAMDITDENNAIAVTLEVPGANAKSVSVEVEMKVMTVEAISTLHHKGMPVMYKRSFRLSDAVDIAGISAKTRDGILTLTLPKSERAAVHKIAVQ
ncbi:MAG: Hsp20/alpha crystallin family protein [Lentisphaeria bacterium]|nr:Hsp20/alpha crystallin family protein [Lentisphaeria bacterium]